MGNYTPGYVRVTPPSEKKAKGVRTHLAPQVVDALLADTKEHVICGGEHHESQERECYEVSQALRDRTRQLRNRVEEIVPGSALARNGTTYGLRLSDKVAMVFVDRVNLEIIRPGPTPEDRQACDIAQEIDAIKPGLVELVEAVILVEDQFEGLIGYAREAQF